MNGRITTAALAIGLALAPVMVRAPRAHACSCGGPQPGVTIDYLAPSDAAFLGEVIGSRLRNIPEGYTRSSTDEVIWTFHVRAAYKGQVSEIQEVVSVIGESSCGQSFELQRTYVVYTRRGPGGLSTGLCDGTYQPDGGTQPIPTLPTVPLDASATTTSLVRDAVAAGESSRDGVEPSVAIALTLLSAVGGASLTTLVTRRRTRAA